MSIEERVRESMELIDEQRPSAEFRSRVMSAITPQVRRSGVGLGAAIAGASVLLIALLAINTAGWLEPALLPNLTSSQMPGQSASSLRPSSATPPTSKSPRPLGSDEIAIPTSPPLSAAGDALLSGTLGGEATVGGGCLWVAQPGQGDQTLARTSIVWPFGFRAFVNPLRLVGPDNETIAKVGDTLELAGGAPPPSYAPTVAQDPCGVGGIYVASGIESVNHVPVGIGKGSMQLKTRAAGTMGDCPSTFLSPIMLVMGDEGLQLRVVRSGENLDARWPDGFTARPGNRIVVVDGDEQVVMTQGVERTDARGEVRSNVIEFCGAGSRTYQ